MLIQIVISPVSVWNAECLFCLHIFFYGHNTSGVGGGASLPKLTSGPVGVLRKVVAFISVKECHIYAPVNGILCFLYSRSGGGS